MKPETSQESRNAPLCGCHGKPMYRRNDRRVGWRCAVKADLACLRYRRSAKGKATTRRDNEKRVTVGKTYFGRTKSAAAAARISEHGRQLLAEFTQQQREARLAAGA